MKLSKQETIKRHRQMWNWISEQSLKQKRCISKKEAFEYFGWNYCTSNCWCCAYARYNCEKCPILWLDCEICIDKSSVFTKWSCSNNYLKASELAKQIANLPERKFEGEGII